MWSHEDFGPPPWYRPSNMRTLLEDVTSMKNWLEEVSKKKEDKPKAKTYTFAEMLIISITLSWVLGPISYMSYNYLWHLAGLK